MSINKKLNLAFTSIIALLLISTFVSMYNSNKVNEKIDEALGQRIELLKTIDEIRVGIGLQGQYIRTLLTNDTDETREQLQHYANYVDENILRVNELATTDTMRNYFKEITLHNNEFNTTMESYLELIDRKDLKNAEVLLDKDIAKANDNILAVAEKMTTFQSNRLKTISKETQSALKTSDMTSIILLIISIIIGIILMIFVRQKISSPLKEMVSAAQTIAAGDLSLQDLKVMSKDEIGQLAEANNTMKRNLQILIQRIQQNAEQLSAAAEELSASTEEVTATTADMADRSNETLQASNASAQAASESAKAMDETATGVHRIAESTQTLHESSSETYKAAQTGGKVIQHANEQMTAINQSSQIVNELVQKLSKQTVEIENITNVITAITEQTNLLALNAAIEAARAGEHGKGFAVVADEVRKLAEESKASANKIVEVIQDIKTDTTNVELAAANSVQSVSEGVRVIEEAGNTFVSIVSAVEKMNIQIEEISAISEEISASAEQVAASADAIAKSSSEASYNVESIAAAIEEQTATMEQVNSIAVDLSQSAQTLQDETLKFKLR